MVLSTSWQTCVVGPTAGEVMETRSGEVWRLVPEARQELKRKQGRWKYGGDIPEGVAAGEGVETVTWIYTPVHAGWGGVGGVGGVILRGGWDRCWLPVE